MSVSIALVSCLAWSPLVQAPQQAVARTIPTTAVLRDGGTLHFATSTWTRKARAAGIGADILYNNTCSSGYFSAQSGDAFVDEGRLPSPTSPTSLVSRPGTAASYTIDGFQISYCTDQTGFSASTTTVNFFEAYTACATVISVTPTAGFALTGLPGSSGLLACWVVTIDLDSPPQSASLTFTMLADGDGSYTAPENTNLFGWSFENSLPDVNQVATGPVISGDPNVCLHYDGTAWDSPVNYAEAGTGMGTQDLFRTENGPTTPGCYFFGGAPFASFHLELYGDACPRTSPGVKFCAGDGTGTGCPCGNNSLLPPPSGRGCLNSLGVGAEVDASGGIICCGCITGGGSITADNVVLNGSSMPNSSALYFQGTTQQSGGLGAVFGDGLRCAGGTVIRLGTKTNAAGASSYPVGADLSISVKGLVTMPGTRTYQIWYRNAAAFCTASTFNLSNGYQINWVP